MVLLGKSNWNPDIGSSAAVESRPVKTLTPDSPIVSNCEPPPLSGDISKDSLNTSSSQAESPKLSSSIKCPSTSVDEANSRLGAASHSVASYPPNQSEPEEEDGEASKKPLEPLAFTIDFGDRSSVKSKKKETPKRFTDRLTSGQKRTPGQSTKPPSEEKKVILAFGGVLIDCGTRSAFQIIVVTTNTATRWDSHYG